jgi:hypothetical protein
MTIHSRIPSQGLRSLPAMPTQTLRIAVEYLGRGQYRGLDWTSDCPSYGRELVARASEPFFASARVLIDLGHDPNATLEMVRKETPDRVDMRGQLGALAKLIVSDPANGAPRIVAWKPSPFNAIRKETNQ